MNINIQSNNIWEHLYEWSQLSQSYSKDDKLYVKNIDKNTIFYRYIEDYYNKNKSNIGEYDYYEVDWDEETFEINITFFIIPQLII